jgi:hypothetical protein
VSSENQLPKVLASENSRCPSLGFADMMLIQVASKDALAVNHLSATEAILLVILAPLDHFLIRKVKGFASASISVNAEALVGSGLDHTSKTTRQPRIINRKILKNKA